MTVCSLLDNIMPMIKRETLQPGFEKSVRSFVAREGRVTEAHKHALAELWPTYGLSLQSAPLDLSQIFGNSNPVILEIGFGTGSSLLHQAGLNPQQNFIGVEVYRTGIAKLLFGVKERKLTNIRVFCADATEVLQYSLADSALSGVQLFFPDPWPKLRHNKRRIVQPDFVNLVHSKLSPQGYFHMATDWQDYAEHMVAVMQQTSGWQQQTHTLNEEARALTKFEARGQRLGHGTWDLIYLKAQ